MCGIIGAIVNDATKARQAIMNIYENQRNRGRQGAGVAIRKPDKTLIRFRARSPEAVFRSEAFANIEAGDYVIFHHRLPTSSPNKWFHNHPIANKDKTVMLIHNGHIINHRSLFWRDIDNNIRYETYNSTTYQYTDSEVLIHLIHDCDVEDMQNIIYNNTNGSAAIAILKSSYDGIILIRNANPIIIMKDDVNHYFASEHDKRYKKLYSMKDGETVILHREEQK